MLDNIKSIALGCDQGGYELKGLIKSQLEGQGYTVVDFGSFSTQSIDYPDVAHPLAQKVDSGTLPLGILICGSGNGVCITANKYPGVRAALCWSVEIARLARLHNDANILCLPGRFIEPSVALEAVSVFLSTPFEGRRHLARVQKIPIAN